MTHLVTGGSGFLGHLITRKLMTRGEHVRVADIWKDPLLDPAVDFTFCDVRNREAVRNVMVGVDVVHHNAALVPLTKSGKKFWDVNVDGSRIVAEEAVKAGVSWFVHMSSSAIYGAPEKVPIMPETPPAPIEAYGRSKLAGETAVQEVCGGSKTKLIIIRPRTIIGHGRLGIFQILFNWVRNGSNIYVIGDGNISFQFIHADDLIDAYMLALENGEPGRYNVGTDRYGTLRKCLDNLIRHAESSSRVIGLPPTLTIATLKVLDTLRLSPLAPWHYLTYHKPFSFDISHVIALGWTPRYSNDAMLKESYDEYLEAAPRGDHSNTQSPHRKRVDEKALWLIRKLTAR